MNNTIREAYGMATASIMPCANFNKDFKIGNTFFWAHHGISSIILTLMFKTRINTNSMRHESSIARIEPA